MRVCVRVCMDVIPCVEMRAYVCVYMREILICVCARVRMAVCKPRASTLPAPLQGDTPRPPPPLPLTDEEGEVDAALLLRPPPEQKH